MKTFIENIDHVSKPIIFMIGKNAKENSELINDSLLNDLWFHLANFPSAHLIAQINNIELSDEELEYVITRGACLLKSCSKQKNINKLEINYTYIRNVELTIPIGSVNITNFKIKVI